jgi:hypothetical protein
LPNLVCADDTAHAAASVATARKKSALDAIAVGLETEQKQNAMRESKRLVFLSARPLDLFAWCYSNTDKRGTYS